MKNLLFTKLKKILVFLLLSAGLCPLSSFSKEKVHICFFELDNIKTSINFKQKMTGKKHKNCPARQEFSETVVHCYQPNPSEEKGGQAFERMINKISGQGDKCDSLVISGHHVGDWYGQTGKLWLKDMEALSCKKEYKNWFAGIKALWLDGCNTVTDEYLRKHQGVKTPDSETVRVLGEKDKYRARRDMEIYQQSYTGSLDENTPLSSRYLRMFPHTQIYGFNGAAPAGTETKKSSDQVGSQSFIYEHLKNLGQALKAEKDKVSDFKKGLQAMFFDEFCNPEKIEAWEEVTKQADLQGIEHQDYKRAYKLGCDLILAKQVLDQPRSKEKAKALAERILDDPGYKDKKNILELANEILKNPGSGKAAELAKLSLLKTLKTINEEDKELETQLTYTHLLFNNIFDTWNTAKKYKGKDPVFFTKVKAQFQTENFKNSLRERIESVQTGSLRKGDYIKFYMDVNDNLKPSFIKKAVRELYNRASRVFQNLSSPRKRDLRLETKRAFAVSVADQLAQYDLLSDEQIKKLVQNKKLFPGDTKNPFVMDTKHKLKFKVQPEAISSTVKNSPAHSLARDSAIRVGTEIHLRRIQKNSGANNKLEDLMAWDKGDKGINLRKDKDREAFVQTFYRQLRYQSPSEQRQLILNLTGKTSKIFQRNIFHFVKHYFKTQPDQIRQLCSVMQEREYSNKKLLCD